ncbi:DUF6134 family protein [Roseiterribacter gracilis]|uniref:DUF3108 domain-containing protein n=1 Tax=Roseiterribacter gracilis TaxID=2812848 RepID=A0A8S8X6Z1_9PROT|nr:hypothetical protein TMPK1_01810 [Rhodospirillales bacterium TMPK1]
MKSHICAALLLIAMPAAADQPKRLFYDVENQTYGHIGTYSLAIETRNGATLITSEAHIRVDVLGVTMFRQEAARHERWVGSRLVEFHGVTTENDVPVKIDGHADGDHFVLTSPSGETKLPGSIRPASPLVADGGGGPIFMTDTGTVTAGKVEDLGEMTISFAGAPTKAHRYRIETTGAREKYEVWMGADRTPLRFTSADARSNSTFTLVP